MAANGRMALIIAVRSNNKLVNLTLQMNTKKDNYLFAVSY